MDAEEQDVRRIFEQALAFGSAPERDRFLATACRDRPELERPLAGLLRAHEQAGAFLRPTTRIAAEEGPGTRVGRYQLLEEIGEGGFGVVYLAEQQEPVRRQVALKILKPGMDSREIVARFEAERQALALMDHPNIARIFDAGTTAQESDVRSQEPEVSGQKSGVGGFQLLSPSPGRPFFVMELVRGLRITEYSDQNQLLTRERLDLFLQVCQAIQHAHQKGVIHRDIKPSNVLVAVHDGVPVPKVIDFGIAKAVGRGLPGSALWTRAEQLLGTPAYMSPEQAGGSGLDIDTRSDIYSLGVLLYELLTGTTPFDPQELMAQEIDTLRRTIREQEPMRPSLRLRTRTGATPSGRHRSPRDEQIALLEGDLDWIVMKCLEKDRGRRYETVGALAADLRRHLAGEVVEARPPSAVYRLRKMIRRHQAVFGAAAAVTLALLAGVAASLWQAVRATRAERWQARLRQEADAARVGEEEHRRAAERERERAEARSYASDMNLAQQALALNNLGRALELLERHRSEGAPGMPGLPPGTARADRRGWEWRYLRGQSRGDDQFTLCRKPVPIFSLALSPDSRLLAIGERNHGHLTVWDLATRREVLRIPSEDRPDQFYIRAAFSPTEPLLAYGSSSGYPPDTLSSRVRVVNVVTREQVAEYPLEFLCSGLAFSADGQLLLTSTPVGTRIREVRSGRVRAEFPVGSHSGTGTPFAVTPDFRRMVQAFGEPGGQVRVFDLADGRELWRTNRTDGTVDAVAISSDGRRVATAGMDEGAVIELWDAADGRRLRRLEAGPGGMAQILFGSDAETVISANVDQTIRIWSIPPTGPVPPPRTLIGHPLEVWRLALMADGRTLISGGKDGSVRFWDLEQRPRPRGPAILEGGPFAGWCFTGEGAVLTCDRRGRVVRWNGERWDRAEPLRETGVEARAACLLPERSEVAIAGGDGSIRVFRWTDTAPPRVVPIFPEAGSHDWDWVLRRHGARLAVGRFDQQVVRDVQLETWTPTRSWRAPGTLVAIDFSADDRFCVMAGYRGGVRVRDFQAGTDAEPSEALPNIGGAAFAPSGERFGISTEQGFVGLWEARTLRAAGVLGGFLRSVTGVVFGPDGTRLAAGSSGAEAVRVYEPDGLQPLITLAAAGDGFMPAFDAGGNVLGALDAAGRIHLWRAPSWEETMAGDPASPEAGSGAPDRERRLPGR